MKKIFIGILIGAILATAVPAAAEEINKRITATIRADYTLELDDKKVELKNHPLAYNGASYLPVREVADLVGKEVDFEDGVIKLKSPIASGLSPAEEFERLKKVLSNSKKHLEDAKKNLEDAKSGKLEATDEQIEVLKESINGFEGVVIFDEKQLADFLTKYPELKESAE